MLKPLEKSSYYYIEKIVLAFFGLFFSYLFIKAFRVISKDKNEILDKNDKFVFLINLLQLISAFLIIISDFEDFIMITFRCLRIFHEILLAMILAVLAFQTQNSQRINSVIAIFALMNIFIWLYFGIFPHYPYDCFSTVWRILSGIILITSVISAYMGYNIIESIKYYEKAEMLNTELHEIPQSECANRKIQIFTLVFCGFFSALVMFLWDIIEAKNKEEIQCEKFNFSYSLTSIFIITPARFLIYYVSPLSVYYVFYYRNITYFYRTDTKEDDKLDIFFDRRSDLFDDFSTSEAHN